LDITTELRAIDAAAMPFDGEPGDADEVDTFDPATL
jgi:hypothetical protein